MCAAFGCVVEKIDKRKEWVSTKEFKEVLEPVPNSQNQFFLCLRLWLTL